jgi:hypothetical protein
VGGVGNLWSVGEYSRRPESAVKRDYCCTDDFPVCCRITLTVAAAPLRVTTSIRRLTPSVGAQQS